MKVVVIASLAYSLINFRGALLAAMVANGHDVVACAPDDDPNVRRSLKDIGVCYRRISMDRTGINPARDLLTLAELIRLFRQEEPDIILAYTQKPIIYAGLAARIARRGRFFPMVSGLGHAFTDDGRSHRSWLLAVVSFLFSIGIRRAETVFVFNGDDAAEMTRHGILRPDHLVVQVSGSGVDTTRFPFRPVPNGPPIFLLIARLLRDKGLVEFVAAARQVRAQHPGARFQLLGPPDCNPTGIAPAQLQAWIDEDGIEYLGQTPDVAPYLAAASVFVLPTYYREGLPRTILEAMATGRPIITTDSPGCRETVVQGWNGFLVPMRDAEALAAAMMEFVKNPELAAQLGRRSRMLAEGNYQVNAVNAVLLRSMGLANNPDQSRERKAIPGHFALTSRRLVDIAVAVVAGTLLLPVMAAIALMIALAHGSPIFFVQQRSGKDGRLFSLIKFRTMGVRPDDAANALPDEARLTATGRLLRRTRLDELPEFWNILKGDMSLVGPRPLLPTTVQAMGAAGSRRGAIRPGLSGWAQVNGNALLTEAEKVALDLWYIDHRSLRLDLLIILKTVLVILSGERVNRIELGRAYAGDTRRRG